MAEESPAGYVLFSLPAYDPSDGKPVKNLRLSGQMAEFFELNASNGYHSIRKLFRKSHLLFSAFSSFLVVLSVFSLPNDVKSFR